MSKPIPIIIPTFNNLEHIIPCIKSIAANTVDYFRFIIVNNGSEELKRHIDGDMQIIHTGKNLGWMGGINAGLEAIKEDCDYVILMNDDTLILPGNYDWINNMKVIMEADKSVAAVGPSSNVVAGWQNMRHFGIPQLLEVKYLIGFCVMIRKQYLDEIGGLDENLPGGDDFDWSIAFRKKGYKLIARRDTFVYHHGFVTGNKVHGDHTVIGGWNSPQMSEATNIAIIKKHGFKWFVETIRNEPQPYDLMAEEYGADNCLIKIVEGKGIDVGCGSNKISSETIGVDLAASGELNYQGSVSEANIKANGDDLPFVNEELDYVVARHNIEHYANPLKTLREWYRVLKPGGRVGITTPDDSKLNGMRLDGSHKHSFSRDAMKDLLEVSGFIIEELGGTANQWNFYVIARKPNVLYEKVRNMISSGVAHA